MAWISRKRLRALEDAFRSLSPDRIACRQLERLNGEWGRALRGIPYYRELARQHGLPSRFDSLAQFAQSVPPLGKDVIQTAKLRFWHEPPAPNHRRITGGSTAAPVQINAWKREFRATALDPWLGRSWYGIGPGDRLFLFWGHAHLLGEGWRGKAGALVRAAKDRVQNYIRQSCYDMSPAAMRAGLERLARADAGFLIGYSCFLDALVRSAEGWQPSPSPPLTLKAVVAAAEGFPFADSAARIAAFFGAPVAMEYGSVETGLIAHTHPDGGYRVFWHNYLLECHGPEAQEVFVTSLFPRCTPLIRYRLGDRFVPGADAVTAGGCSALSFERVAGRSNRPIVLPGGRLLHSEAVSHIVRGMDAVLGYQFVCADDGVTLRVRTRRALTEAERAEIRRLAGGVDAELGERMRIAEVEHLQRAISGKTPMVVVA